MKHSRWQKFAYATFAAGISLGVQRLHAVSAENEYVIVSCPSPAVRIDVDGADFVIFAPRTVDSFSAEVAIEAKSEWMLAEPSSSLRMKGGDRKRYKVRSLPEDAQEGFVVFHNYFIGISQKGGSSDVVVPVGENVIYAARKDDSNCESDWLVNGESKNKTSSIVFNRNWWNVPSWFIPSLDCVKPNYYYVDAHDSKNSVLRDSGIMTVIGVDGLQVSGSGGSYGFVGETLYVEKGCQLLIQAIPIPNAGVWPEGNPKWTGATPQATSRDVAILDTSSARELEVAASCGDSKVVMPIVVFECIFNLYVKPPSGDDPIDFTLNPSSSNKIDSDVGHTSWKLEVKPALAREYLKTLATDDKLKHLNICVGYYPNAAISMETGAAPGYLVSNDKSAGLAKTYSITVQQLLAGLEATYTIESSPETYVLGMVLYFAKINNDGSREVLTNCKYEKDYNCTSVCMEVMHKIGLPQPSTFIMWGGERELGSDTFKINYWGNSPFELYKSLKSQSGE